MASERIQGRIDRLLDRTEEEPSVMGISLIGIIVMAIFAPEELPPRQHPFHPWPLFPPLHPLVPNPLFVRAFDSPPYNVHGKNREGCLMKRLLHDTLIHQPITQIFQPGG